MSRGAVVAVALLVLVSSVVPVSALSEGVSHGSFDVDPGTDIQSETATDLDGEVDTLADVVVDSTSRTDPASAVGVSGRSTVRSLVASGKTGNTGFEPHYYYFQGLVNAANGNLYLSTEELTFGARGGDVTFVRSYNSLRSGEHGPFGFGWTHSFAMRLEERPGEVVFLDADGSAHSFTATGGGYAAPAGLHARLRSTAGGFALDRTDGQTLHFDADGTLQWIEDRNGNRLTLTYDGANLAAVEDDSGQRLAFDYTAEGRIERVTDPLGRTVEYGYETGDLVSVTDPMGRTTNYDYYANHKLDRRESPVMGPLSVDYYDGSDRVRCLSTRVDCTETGHRFDYDPANATASSLSVVGDDRTTVRVNDAGNPVELTNAFGSVSVVWDGDLNPVEVRNETGTYTFDYDEFGNRLASSGPNGTVGAAWRTTETADRLLSTLRSRTDRRGRTTTYTYDVDGNRVSVTDPAGRTRTLEYDDWGYATSETDFGGHETAYTYDTRGFRTSVTDPTGRTTTFGYDAIGRRTSETNSAGASYNFTYDADGNLLTRTDPLGGLTRATYDDSGVMLRVTDARGRTIDPRDRPTVAPGEYRTDDRGRVVSATGSDGRITVSRDLAPGRVEGLTMEFGSFTREVDYRYDAFARLTGVDGPGGTTNYEYDTLDRVTRLVGPSGEWVEYDYDAAGRRAGATYSNGVTTNYTYDDAGRLLRVRSVGPAGTTGTTSAGTTPAALATSSTTTATPGPTPEPTPTPSTATSTAPTPTPAPTPAATTTATGTGVGTETGTGTPTPSATTSATLAARSTAASAVRVAAVGGPELLNLTYSYDVAGNVATVTDRNGSVTGYGYDELNRLVSMTYPSGKTVEYTYDVLDNRLTRTVNGTVERYRYSSTNELLEAGATSYRYDADGNRVRKTVGGENTTYQYGPQGRLRSVVLPDGDRVSFSYLPSGERLSKTTPEGTTYYAYVSSDVVAEFAANGSLLRRYTHAPGVDQPLAVEEDGRLSFFHQDARNDVRAMTDANGSLVGTYDYDPFGTSAEFDAAVSPYGFAGRRYDPDTGLYYNRMRYYDPSTGVFTREDPLGISAGVNYYRYASNNPNRFTDPSGLLDWWTGGCVSGGPQIGALDVNVLKSGSCTGSLSNAESQQSCEIEASVTDLGLFADAKLGSAGIESMPLSTQGPACGGALQGITFYCLGPQGSVEAAGGVTAGIGGCISQGGLASGFQGNAGVSVDLGAGAGIGLARIITIDSVDCNCVLVEDPKYAGCKQCDDDDDDDDRPPGGDHPDDNHDLSVLGYDGVYPSFEYDRGASVAVLDRGFVDEFEDFLTVRGRRAASVDVRTPQEELDRYDVLVVPTGGLLGLNSLASFEEKLDAHVRNGGTLVVLPQQRGYEFGPVPGNLRGYGWLEDQSCQFNSVGLTNACAVTSSLGSETASVNVDGYFTDWPENATILLSRTVNGQPAMLSYDHGEGRVLATTVYTDWASGHHASSFEGEALLTNVLAWSTSPPDLTTYRRGETVTRDVNVTNYGELGVDEVRIDLRSPDGTVHSATAVRTPLSGFSNGTVPTSYDVPTVGSLGIWQVGYTLVNDSHGEIQRVEAADHIAVGRFTDGEGLFRSENVTFAVTSDAERYAYGSNATFRITIRNSGTANETVTAWWAYPHNHWRGARSVYGAGTTRAGGVSALNETVTVPAGGETTIAHEIPVRSTDRLWAQFYRGDRSSTDYLGTSSRGFFAFRPSVETEVGTTRAEYRLGEQVDVSLRLAGEGGTARTEVRVLGPESTLVYEEEVLTDFGTDNVSTDDLRFDIPVDAPAGFYTVVAEPHVGGEKVGFDSAQFFVPDARLRAVPEIPSAVTNGSRVAFTLVNIGQEGSNTGLNVSLAAPDGSTVWRDSATVDVPPNDRVTVPFDVSVGPRRFGEYRLVYTVTPETDAPFTREYALPNSYLATVAFDRPSYAIRETMRAILALTNDGRFGGSLPVEVSVPDAGYVDSTRLAIAPGENGTAEHVVALPTALGAGDHRLVVRLGGADPSTRVFTFVVPPSSLESGLVTSGPVAPGGNVSLGLSNTGGVDTNASCALVVTGPRGVRVDERTVTAAVTANGTATVEAGLPAQAISGTYFLESSCTDLGTGETVSGTRTFAVDGLDATVSLSTDKEVYATGEDVTVTVAIDNRGDAVENGTLTVEVTDPSPDAPTGTGTGGVPTVAETTGVGATTAAAPLSPVAPEPFLTSSVTALDGTTTVEFTSDDRFTSDSLLDGTPPGRLATSAAVALAGATNITGNRTITNDTVWADRVVAVDGFLLVESGGSLTLRNTTLVFEVTDDLDAGLEVRDGGTFRLLDGSTVTSDERFDSAYVVGERGSTVELRDSTLNRIGRSTGDFTRNYGVSLHGDGAVVENVTFADNSYALVVYNSTGATVRNSTFGENENLRVLEATGTHVEGNTFARSVDLSVLRSADVRVGGNTLDQASLEVQDSTNVTVADNVVLGRNAGMILRQAGNGLIENNSFDSTIAIYAYQSDGNLVANNTVRLGDTRTAVEFVESSDNTFRGNDVDGGERGISLRGTSNTTLVGNSFNGSTVAGIVLEESLGATMRDNALTNTTLAVDRRILGARPLANYRHDVDTSNTIDGRPVRYLVGLTDATAPTDGGILYLVGAENVTAAGSTGRSVNVVGSRNVTVRDGRVGNDTYGVFVSNSTGTTVTNVTTRYNVEGITVRSSNGSTVADNIAANNTDYGIRVRGPTGAPFVGVEVRGNRVTGDRFVDASILLEYVEDGLVTGNDVFRARDAGIHVLYSPGVIVDDNRVTEGSFGYGIEVGREGGTITNNVVAGGTGGIELWQAADSLVEGNEVTGAARALEFDRTTNTTIRANRISDVRISAIDSGDSTDDTVVGNVVRNVSEGGFVFGEVFSLTVRDNRLLNVSATGRFGNPNNPVPAIDVQGVSFAPRNRNVTIENNTVTANGPGIRLDETDVASVDDNDVANTTVGFVLVESFGATVRNHSLGNSPFDVTGSSLRYYVHDIDGSNTVAGSPVAYLLNRTDATVDGRGLGQVWLVNATNVTLTGGGTTAVVRSVNVTVADVVVSGLDYGVYVETASNVTVRNATVEDGTHGVYVLGATRTTVRNSTVTNASYGVLVDDEDLKRSNYTAVLDSTFVDTRYGVDLERLSREDLIAGSEFTGSEWGVFADRADNVTVRENELVGNEVGILLYDTERGVVRTNVVVDGTTGVFLDRAAYSLVYDNYLDNPGGDNGRESFTRFPNDWNVTKTPGENIVGGPFLGGNFWGDYTGADLDGDGLGDTDLGSGGFAEGDLHPLVEPVDRGPVVYSTNLSVDVTDSTSETVTVTVPGGVLSGSPGKLKLSARLTSTSTQTVAVEDPPFYVLDGDTVLTLSPDARQYAPGETVELTGALENRGNASTTYDLLVSADGSDLLTERVTLAAGETYPYATNVTVTAAGTVAVLASADGVTVEDSVEVIEPQVAARIVAPSTVGRAPFETALELENTGRIDATVDASFLGTTRSVTLAPNETLLVTETTTVTGDAVLAATLSGDVSRTVTRAVEFGEAATVTVSPEPVYAEGTVGVPYVVENTGRLETELVLNATIDGRERTRAVYLPVDGATNGTFVFDLAAGNYTLAYESPFENGSVTVRVAARNQVGLTAAAGNVTNGTLAVEVTLTNTGPNDVQGDLRVNSTAFDASSEFSVAAGATLNRTVNVTVPVGTAPGNRTLTVEAVTEGERLGRITDQFVLLGPRIELVAGPGATTYGLGETAELNLTLENVGNAEGPALVDLTVPGIHEETRRVFLAPDERRVVTVAFLVPDDLAAGTYPVEYRLDDGPTRETDLVVEGMNVSVSSTLNESLYREGTTARLTLAVENERSFPVSLFSRVQYNGYDEVRAFDLDADGTTSLAFDVPVRDGSDRKVFYSVYAGSGRSLYIDGAYLHRQDPNVTLYTDAQVYEIGETVTATVEPSAPGRLDVYAPGFSFGGNVSGQRNLSFAVPALRSGSYNVVYAFENTTNSYPIDVDGYTARVLESTLDADGYTGGEDVGLALDVEADRAVPVTVTAEVYGEGSTPLATTTTSRAFSAGRNQVSLVLTLPANTSGIHSVVYRLDADLPTPITLATGSEYVDVAAASGVNTPPVARFDYTPAGPTAGEAVAFDAGRSSDPDGRLTTFEWDFDGDLAFDASGERPDHTFPAAGDYAVTLRVTDDSGATNLTRRTVTVAAAPATPTPTPSPTPAPTPSPTPTATPTPTPSSGGGGGGGSGGGGVLPDTGPGGVVELAGATLVNGTATVGSDVIVEVSLRNYDPLSGRITLTLAADGSPVAERTVSVGASTDRTVLLRHRFATPGTYALAVDGVEVGTVTVRASPDGPTPTDGPTTTGRPTATPPDGRPTATAAPDPGSAPGIDTPTATAPSGSSPTVGTPTAADGPGFGALGGLLALGLFALLARRKRGR